MLAKLCFDFMIDTVSIELAFCQQVATEPRKIFRNSHFAAKVATVVIDAGLFSVTEIKLNQQGAPQESLREMRSH